MDQYIDYETGHLYQHVPRDWISRQSEYRRYKMTHPLYLEEQYPNGPPPDDRKLITLTELTTGTGTKNKDAVVWIHSIPVKAPYAFPLGKLTQNLFDANNLNYWTRINDPEYVKKSQPAVRQMNRRLEISRKAAILRQLKEDQTTFDENVFPQVRKKRFKQRRSPRPKKGSPTLSVPSLPLLSKKV